MQKYKAPLLKTFWRRFWAKYKKLKQHGQELSVADPDQAFGGGSQIRVRQNIHLFEIPQLLCDNRWVSHKSGYFI